MRWGDGSDSGCCIGNRSDTGLTGTSEGCCLGRDEMVPSPRQKHPCGMFGPIRKVHGEEEKSPEQLLQPLHPSSSHHPIARSCSRCNLRLPSPPR